jgi:hypothetical protein
MEQPGILLAEGFQQLMDKYGLTRQDVRHRTEERMWEAGLRPIRENIRKNLTNLLDDHSSVSSAQTIEELVMFGLGGTSLDVRHLQGVAGHLSAPLAIDRRLVQELIMLTIEEMQNHGRLLVYIFSRWFEFWAMSASWAGFFEGGIDHLRDLITLRRYPGRILPIHVFDFIFDNRLGLRWQLLDVDDLRRYQMHRYRLENILWSYTAFYRHLPDQMVARLPEADAIDFMQKWKEVHDAPLRELIPYDVAPGDYSLRYSDGSEVLDLLLHNFYLDVTGGSFIVAYLTPRTEADRVLVERIIAPTRDADPVYLWDRDDLPIIQQPLWP